MIVHNSYFDYLIFINLHLLTFVKYVTIMSFRTEVYMIYSLFKQIIVLDCPTGTPLSLMREIRKEQAS